MYPGKLGKKITHFDGGAYFSDGVAKLKHQPEICFRGTETKHGEARRPNKNMVKLVGPTSLKNWGSPRLRTSRGVWNFLQTAFWF